MELLSSAVTPFLLFLFVCFVFFWDKVLLCTSGGSGAHFVAQTALELAAVSLLNANFYIFFKGYMTMV